ncbi:MAG TPA: hypothetical protein VJM50_09520 [Pyrinomonadaceae bacterium]|nr:hypothetical protein [Pyrinomonadaceae bacterium]
MKGKYLRRIGGLALTALMLVGIGFASTSEAQAQTGQKQVQQRRVIVRRIYRPWGFGYRNWWGYPYRYGWGYDPWSSHYGFRYNHYVFDNGEDAVEQAHKDGFKTGKDDGKKDKSFNPQRSHYFKEAGFGNFGEVYRSAFSRGYEEGYRVGGAERLAKEERKRAEKARERDS